MTRVCAWCNCVIGCKPPLEDADVTHGICLACLQALLEEGPPPVAPFVLAVEQQRVYFSTT
jgi:hypothetical protein